MSFLPPDDLRAASLCSAEPRWSLASLGGASLRSAGRPRFARRDPRPRFARLASLGGASRLEASENGTPSRTGNRGFVFHSSGSYPPPNSAVTPPYLRGCSAVTPPPLWQLPPPPSKSPIPLSIYHSIKFKIIWLIVLRNTP